MLFKLGALATLAASVAAAPTGSNPQCQRIQANANFDDVSALPATTLNQLPVPYMGLYFQSLKPDQYVPVPLAPGLIPHSPPKYVRLRRLSFSWRYSYQ